MWGNMTSEFKRLTDQDIKIITERIDNRISTNNAPGLTSLFKTHLIEIEYLRRQTEKQDKIISLLTQLLGNQQESSTDRLAQLDHNE